MRHAAPHTRGEPDRLPHSHFEVAAGGSQPARGQILAWRERVGHVMDLEVTRASLLAPFHGAIDRYLVADMSFTDCRCDGVTLQRSLARISTDSARHHAIQVFVEGSAGVVAGERRNPQPSHGGILLTDLGQPIQMRREATRALSFFVPRTMMDVIFMEAEAAHGRIVETDTPLSRLAVAHAAALGRDLPTMTPEAAVHAMRTGVQVLVGALRRGVGLDGSTRAAVRSAVLARARRLIDADPGQAELSPAGLLAKLEISRATLYRLFEHEGGVQAYIRKSRLRLPRRTWCATPKCRSMTSPTAWASTARPTYARIPSHAWHVTARPAGLRHRRREPCLLAGRERSPGQGLSAMDAASRRVMAPRPWSPNGVTPRLRALPADAARTLPAASGNRRWSATGS